MTAHPDHAVAGCSTRPASATGDVRVVDGRIAEVGDGLAAPTATT